MSSTKLLMERFSYNDRCNSSLACRAAARCTCLDRIDDPCASTKLNLDMTLQTDTWPGQRWSSDLNIPRSQQQPSCIMPWSAAREVRGGTDMQCIYALYSSRAWVMSTVFRKQIRRQSRNIKTNRQWRLGERDRSELNQETHLAALSAHSPGKRIAAFIDKVHNLKHLPARQRITVTETG